LLQGHPAGGGRLTTIFRNEGGGAFSNIHPNLAQVESGTFVVGDYDNDGSFDLFLAGSGTNYFAGLFRNLQQGIFESVGPPFISDYETTAACGDYDRDGRLDLIVGTLDGGSGFRSVFYRASGFPSNAPP